MGAVYLPFESQRRLIELSRMALEEIVYGATSQGGQVEDPYLLSSEYGSFVTLHKGDKLRGCIGTCLPTNPLYETVAEMTQAAASQDHRFSSITKDEIHGIHIDISVLSPLERAPDPLSLIVGEHGLHVVLSQVCLKADLPEDSWRSKDTQVSSFTTLIIEERK
jgi:AMMECR1 domain-containing protein